MNAPPQAADARYQAAQRLAIAGRHEEAVAEYSAAIVAAPKHLKAICGRGLALQQIGQHDEALVDFEHILALQPDWAGVSIVHFGRASSLYMLGEFAAAITACDEALRAVPAHSEAMYVRGISSKALGELDAAESDMDKTLQREPNHLGALSTLGKLYLLKEDYASAIEVLTRAIVVASPASPDAIDCLRLRGVSFQSMSNHTEAIADLTQVIALCPQEASAYFRRAQSYEVLGEAHLSAADVDHGKALLPVRQLSPDEQPPPDGLNPREH